MSVSASAITHTITQQGLSFAPEQLTVEVGDVILFQWTSGNHTIVVDGIERYFMLDVPPNL